MRISIRNLTSAVISTPLGQLDPAGSLASDLPEGQVEGVVTELAKLGSRVSFSVGGADAGDVITSPLTLYVEMSGNDSNPGTVDKPFKTIQKAISILSGKTINSASGGVTISVGLGTFDGFALDGIDIRSPRTTEGGIVIKGTLQDATTLATGTATGTVTTGISNGFTDSGQSWTADDLKGKWVIFSGLTGASSIFPILTNTDTSLTLLGGIAVTTGWTYRIVECGTTVLSTYVYDAATANSKTCIYVGAINAQSTSQVEVRNVKCAISGSVTFGWAVIMRHSSATLRLTAVEWDGNSSVAAILPAPGASLSINSVIGRTTVAQTNGMIASTSTGGVFGISGASNFFMGPATPGGTGIALSGASYCSLTRLFFENFATGLSYGSSRIGSCADTMGGKNCTNVISVGAGGLYSHFIGGHPLSSGNTNFLAVSKGGRVNVGSFATCPGATNEISLDGVAYTLAAMRANSPKLVTNTYGSIVYE